MKAISLWQPWASLIATGAKRFETRSWSTKHRGALAICAAKGGLSKADMSNYLYRFYGGLAPLIGKPLDPIKQNCVGVHAKHLPFGEIVAIVNLIDCIRTDDMTEMEIGTDRPFGDFSPGRYAWGFDRHIIVPVKPMPVVGRQGLFNIDFMDKVDISVNFKKAY